MSLRQISQLSFKRREAGENIPYLAICQYEGINKEVTELNAIPISKQKELKKFFEEVAPNSVTFPRYTFRVTNFGVMFRESLGKISDGKQNFIYH